MGRNIKQDAENLGLLNWHLREFSRLPLFLRKSEAETSGLDIDAYENLFKAFALNEKIEFLEPLNWFLSLMNSFQF